MSGHGIPLPPVALLAAAIAQRVAPAGTRACMLRHGAATVVGLVSSALLAASVSVFRGQRTTVDPTAPRRASTLVTTGPNARTRNPMYLGMVGLLVAHALDRGSARAWVPVAGFAVLIDRVQIRAEEQALRDRFGAEYTAYCARTRRWL